MIHLAINIHINKRYCHDYYTTNIVDEILSLFNELKLIKIL